MGYSLGFWLEDEKNSSSPMEDKKNRVELHINYWSLEAKQICNYLDIGLRLELKDENLKKIHFYLPFKLAKENYMGNLGDVICSKNDLIELIFNEKLNSSSEGVNYKDIIFAGKEKETLRLYKELETGSEGSNVIFTFDEENTGTKISFPSEIFNKENLKNEVEHKYYHYFRFRLRLTPEHVKVLSQNYEPQDRLVVSKFEKTEIIDFRLNELRDLPGAICNALKNNFILEQIHFFLIRDIHDELKLAHDKYKRCRLLEKKVWDKYLEFKNDYSVLPIQMLIYHFKEKNNDLLHIERFNAFAKFARVKVTFTSIAAFVFCVVILGAIGSLIATVFVESRPLGLYAFFKNISFHIFISIIILCTIFCVVRAFWNKNYEFQCPWRKK